MPVNSIRDFHSPNEIQISVLPATGLYSIIKVGSDEDRDL